MQKALRWFDSITINIFYFSLTVRGQTLTPLLLPLLVQQFVGDETKGSSYGNIRLYSLMIALLVQALMGMLSDRSTSVFGKRRPFILTGAVLDSLAFIAIGIIAGTMSGDAGYKALFAAVLFSMFASNISHGAVQGLIPDLVPENKRGLYSAVKALFELPLPLIFVSFFIARLLGSGNVWGSILVVIAVLLIGAALSLLVRETPQEKAPKPLDWVAIGGLAGMTAAFTLIIFLVGAAVKALIPVLTQAEATTGFFLITLVGLAGMLISVALGVIVSLTISLGKGARKQPSFTWWIINRLAFLVGANNLASFLLYFIQERFPELSGNAAAQPTAMLVMFVGVAILIAALPSGWLTDKIGTKPVIALSGVLATIGTAAVVTARSMPPLYVGGILVGVAAGAFFSANWALGTSLVPKDQAGRYLGISNLAGAGAGAIGAYIGGPIGDGVGYVVLMTIYGCLFLFSTLALLKIKAPELSTEVPGL